MTLSKTRWIAAIMLCGAVATPALAQPTEPAAEADSTPELAAAGRKLAAESAVTTNHEVTVKGQRFPYRATAGTQPVWNEDGDAIASLFYVYYERTDVEDRATRPLFISFNGGPGSASVWMHIAYTGPRVLTIDDEGFPVQPYGIRENPHTILDVADIVFVNPVNTGYSRILDDDVERETFFGVNADIEYLAEWVNTFVTRQSRWTVAQIPNR